VLLPPSPCGGRQPPPSLPPFTNCTIATARERACAPPSSSSCVGARVWAALQGPTSLHAPHESRCFANLGGQPLLPCALCAALCSHRALPGHCPFACPPSYGPEPTIGSLSFGTAREFQMRKNSDNSNKIRCSSHESLACLGTLKLNGHCRGDCANACWTLCTHRAAQELRGPACESGALHSTHLLT